MTESISSRTPEGDRGHCPVCDAPVCIECSRPSGDATCPRCGVLLWFYLGHDQRLCFDAREIDATRALLRERLATHLGIAAEAIKDEDEFLTGLGADSLDKVELVMELEEEFDLNISDEDAQSLRTVADALAFLQRRRNSSGSLGD